VSEPTRLTHELAVRPLNVNDLAEAHRLPQDERVRLMQGILNDLLSIEPITSRDAAGIARRGSPVFREHLEGRTIKELAAAYIELRMLGAQMGLVDAVETAYGIPDDILPKDSNGDVQAQYRQAYLEQLRRQSCPGCGDDGHAA
jgi:hypothetical protein